ncbi:MAG: hypothetical protein ACK4X1_06220 [Terricaulis sp.]
MAEADLDGGAKGAPTRSEVAEYVHDLVSQLACMARSAGLNETADALVKVRAVVEGEF